jgi:hypothetical protein
MTDLGSLLPSGTEAQTQWLTNPDKFRAGVICALLCRAETALDLPISNTGVSLLGRIDVILAAAQRRKLSPALYARIWALRELVAQKATV